MTQNKSILIEIFSSNFCKRCETAKQEIKKLVNSVENNTIRYREVDVVEELDSAVSLGILNTPSIVINGQLIFTSTPTQEALKKAIDNAQQ